MKNMKRIATGLAFIATIALALLANGGDAYAKSKSNGGNVFNHDTTIIITITVGSSSSDILPLGITWE